MAQQERALRTRRTLVREAATQFDRRGYEGTSLARVSKAVGMTMGALTFHFRTKGDLADAVEEEGRAATRATIDKVTSCQGSALQSVINLTFELTRLLDEDVTARAATRLCMERGTVPWSAIWLPEVQRLLEKGYRQGQLKQPARPMDVTDLVEYLIGGTGTCLRSQDGNAIPRESAIRRLERIWAIALSGIAAVPTGISVTTLGQEAA